MKEKRLSLRLSAKRMYALQIYAASKEKSITAVIEDWIDSFRQNAHSSSLLEASLREALPTPTTNIPD
ncbi:MAG: hypothetical protein ACSI46_20580 [Gloeotrichia echinulata DVL01]|jgi:hypothetical protein|nr:hypothetical protein [Gloeotrichia echinulata DEX184]